MKERRALKPDAQPFDEIRIVTLPRYKTSGLSGDEWRISAVVRFYRKGVQVFEDYGLRNVETAVSFLPMLWHKALDEARGFYAGENNTCDQEGCSSPASVTYKLKKQFCQSGHESNPYEFDSSPLIRKFCERHSTRGDCGLEDADRNYELITGEVNEPSGMDKSPSIFGGIIKLSTEPSDGG